jgi:hypothetical protein
MDTGLCGPDGILAMETVRKRNVHGIDLVGPQTLVVFFVGIGIRDTILSADQFKLRRIVRHQGRER